MYLWQDVYESLTGQWCKQHKKKSNMQNLKNIIIIIKVIYTINYISV